MVDLGGALERKSSTRFYRVSKHYPPDDRSYVTPRDKLWEPPIDASDEKKRAWDALSAFDTEEGTRRQARMFTHLGNLIVRYDIPDGSGLPGNSQGSRGTSICEETRRNSSTTWQMLSMSSNGRNLGLG